MRLTNYEKRCEELSERIKPMTKAQERWIECRLPAFIVLMRRKEYCSECGSEVVDGKCTGCGHRYGKKQSAERAVKGVAEMRYYYGIETTICGEQVHRHFIVAKTAHPKNGNATFSHYECSRVFMNEKGHTAFQHIEVSRLPWVYDRWICGTEMRTRNKESYNAQQRLNTQDWAVYPRMSVAPWLKKRGFDKVPTRYSDIEWKAMLLKNPFAEWLAKKGYTSWLNGASVQVLQTNRRELELADKHGYAIEDIKVWIDTVEMLRELGKDTLNAKWSRPDDLDGIHDMAVRLIERKRDREEMEKIKERNAEYIDRTGMFFGLSLSDGVYKARVIRSAMEMVEEGSRMHHCVADYVGRKDSLIFTVRGNDGGRVATVEWSLKMGKVVQCRGLQNGVPEGYDRIMAMFGCVKGEIAKIRRMKKIV